MAFPMAFPRLEPAARGQCTIIDQQTDERWGGRAVCADFCYVMSPFRSFQQRPGRLKKSTIVLPLKIRASDQALISRHGHLSQVSVWTLTKCCVPMAFPMASPNKMLCPMASPFVAGVRLDKMLCPHGLHGLPMAFPMAFPMASPNKMLCPHGLHGLTHTNGLTHGLTGKPKPGRHSLRRHRRKELWQRTGLHLSDDRSEGLSSHRSS
jgi:hypothetical protein